MNRRRAYRKLLSRSAASQPSVVEVYENFAFYKMADNPRHIPVVKLKIGEAPTSSQRRGRSVAELNNLRSNYSHFCHYRKSSGNRREFPPLRSSPAPPSPAPPPASPCRDTTVIFMLRGTQRRSRSRKGSVASQAQLPEKTVGQDAAQKSGNQNFSGHLIVKRKDTLTPTTTTTVVGPGSAPLRSVDFAIPTAPNSASDGIGGYEIRGSSVFKSSTSEQREDDEVLAYGGRLLAPRACPGLPGRPPADRARAVVHQRFVPRPGSYVTARRRELVCYENERPGVMYDHRGVYYDGRKAVTLGGRGGNRQAGVDDGRTPANVSTYVFPIDERGLRLTQSQHPQQLTQKNLEIFDYLHSPKPTFGAIVTPQESTGSAGVNRRVLDWVQERQLDMTALLREVRADGATSGTLPPTPEVNELNHVTPDLDDPDLEVYDLTKEEDFLSRYEVIDEVIDDMSCDG